MSVFMPSGSRPSLQAQSDLRFVSVCVNNVHFDIVGCVKFICVHVYMH